MNINNLLFFDRNGQSYNLTQDSNGVWSGADYFLPISTSLYDVSNVFIVEKVGSSYLFPTLDSGSKLVATWQTAESASNFFLFTVTASDPETESDLFMNRLDSLEVKYVDFQPLGGGDLNLVYPLQVNVGFAPTEEVAYSRVLNISYVDSIGNSTLVASISFYGEGEGEDERFRVWLANFGIKFNREDALILKDYDLKEGLPDWQQINQARKQLLVNRDQVYPYVGTYKGMMNLIDLMGYRDILRVKEYWRDKDTKSSYYNKFAMVDVTDLMTLGSIDQVDLVDLNGQIKKGGKFRKTEFLALVYEFSVATDTYDEHGLPNVELTTAFEPNEIFYKLNKLATKLKNEILPVNVKIKDIIGEFIYFERLSIRTWSDQTLIDSLEINDTYSLKLRTPLATNQYLRIRDIRSLYPKNSFLDFGTSGTAGTSGTSGTSGDSGDLSAFPIITFNESTTDPYSNWQMYPIADVPDLISAIESYYVQVANYEFYSHGDPNPLEAEDDSYDRVGCPICLEAFLSDLMMSDFGGATFSEFTANHYTIGNVRYKSGYEIEWNIRGPQGYVFVWRGKVPDLIVLPHVLPHVGQYEISATVYNLQGTASVSKIWLTVLADEPSIEVFTKIQDKYSYRFMDLGNVMIQDMNYSTLYMPSANVLQSGDSASTLQQHYIDWNTYRNAFGIGGPLGQAERWTDGIGFEPISSSLNDVSILWGTGTGNGQPTLGDYGIARISELKFNRLCDLSYSADTLNGFYIPTIDATQYAALNFTDGDVSNDISLATYSDVQDLCDQLNASTESNLLEYNYSVIGGSIHAQSFRQDRSLNRIITTVDQDGNRRRIYSFCEPFGVYSNGLFDSIDDQLEQVALKLDRDLLFLDAPFLDVLQKTGETVYSNDSITVPFSLTTVTFNLTRQQTFGLIPMTKIRVSSISDPTVYMEGTLFTQSTPNIIALVLTGTGGSGTTKNDWAFTYLPIIPSYPTSFANASDPMYWINRSYVSFGSNDYGTVVSGFIPSNYDHNTFTLSNLKIGTGALAVPVFQPIFAVVPNIPSKKQCVWTLRVGTTEIVKIRSLSYFVWKFDEPGEYYLTVEVTDARDNVFEMQTAFNVNHVKSIEDYKKYVELELNRRKYVSLPSPM